mmetsp:Transcript_29023/g.69092  ORF Transcript_29023/g.69092 Transcript_29023/m.69092 type:complete len:227 (-) Transcript_29023:856-1536(-)
MWPSAALKLWRTSCSLAWRSSSSDGTSWPSRRRPHLRQKIESEAKRFPQLAQTPPPPLRGSSLGIQEFLTCGPSGTAGRLSFFLLACWRASSMRFRLAWSTSSGAGPKAWPAASKDLPPRPPGPAPKASSSPLRLFCASAAASIAFICSGVIPPFSINMDSIFLMSAISPWRSSKRMPWACCMRHRSSMGFCGGASTVLGIVAPGGMFGAMFGAMGPIAAMFGFGL